MTSHNASHDLRKSMRELNDAAYTATRKAKKEDSTIARRLAEISREIDDMVDLIA